MAHMIQNIYFTEKAWRALETVDGPSISKKVCTAILTYLEHEEAYRRLGSLHSHLEAKTLMIQNLEKECRRLRAHVRSHMASSGIPVEQLYNDFIGYAGDGSNAEEE